MPRKKYIKIIASIFILGQLVFPSLVFAQLSGLTTVPTSDAANGSGGVLGTAANALATGLLETQDKLNQSMAVGEAAYFKGDTSMQMGFGGLALISGGASLKAQLDAKLAAISGFITARQGVRNSLMGIVAPNTFTAARKQTLLNEVDAAITSLKARGEQVEQQGVLATQGLWKTLVFNILLKTTKSVSEKMVNSLVQNYGIKNFSNYADAVATQVYDNQFIAKNSKDGTEQMIMRSMLNNPAAQNRIQPAVFEFADTAMGFDPETLDTSDPEYYTKLSGTTNPALYNAIFTGKTQQAQAMSLATAQSEIAQSGGLKTPRNCSGTMQQQQSIDQSYKMANDFLGDRQALLNNLLQAKKAGMPVDDEDIAKAQADVAKAKAELNAMPTKTNKVLVDICKDIVSPPSLINKGIDEAFKATGQKLGTYNDNNLPMFVTLITDVASNISNSLIFGGSPSVSNLLSENAGNLAKATSMGVGFTAHQAKGGLEQGISFSYEKTNGGATEYSISWDASGIKDASYVTISGGTGILGTTRLPISASNLIQTSANSNYTLQVYDKSGKKIGGPVVLELKVETTQTAYNGSAGPLSIRGAFAAKPQESPRGPAGIQPRGPY